jgi:hypothetical protein
MVDVVAGIDPNLFFDPIFWDNQSLLFPVWLWLILVLAFVGFIALVCMVYIWFIMRPVAGYGAVGDAATAKGSPTQVFSIWKNRSFVIESMWYYCNLLTYGNPLTKMQMWFHNSEKAVGVAANKPVMITRDGFNGTIDFIAEMAICAIPPRFNRDWGFELVPRVDIEGKQLIDDNGQPMFTERERRDNDGIPYILTSFSTIRNRMPVLEKLYPDGINIPIYQPYDVSEIYRWTPQNEDSLKFGGTVIEDAKEWAAEDEKEKPGLLDRFGLVIICGIIGIGSLGGLWYVLPLGH